MRGEKFAPYMSSTWKLGLPRDGCQAMQPGSHRVDDLFLSARTVPNEVQRSNSKRGLIDDVICIVRTRNARRMAVLKTAPTLALLLFWIRQIHLGFGAAD